MEQQTIRDIIHASHWPRVMLAAALGMLSLFLFALTMSTLKSYHYIGSGVTATNTITVSGMGEVYAVPDIATFTATVRETGKDVPTVQDAANKKNNAVLAYLKEQGIDEKDVQTTDYSIAPQYSYESVACVAGVYCPPGRQKLDGYQVSETLTIKVRDTKKAGELLSGVGSRGVSEVSSLSFTVDNEDDLKVQARDKAVAKAQAKAKQIADALGVDVVRVVGFSEDGYSPVPMYARDSFAGGVAMSAKAVAAPEIATGQNKIVSNVSVTYEIQ